jgi:poly-gamma-glutamate synthesis protein (capsule biosynthesis protein)
MVTLLLTGDIMFGGQFLEFKERVNVDFRYPFQQIMNELKQADIVFGNLESPLSKRGKVREDKGSILYSPPEVAVTLEELNYTILCLGNNHMHDYGDQGLMDTIDILKNSEISYVGAGRNIDEARQAVTIEKKGLKCAFLAYTTDARHVKSIIATEETGGTAYYDFDDISADIGRIKGESDIICVSLHWGHEYYDYPSPQQVELAHKIVEAGVDILIGHHPHVIQGFERYKRSIIFYSLGNSFFPDFYDKNGNLHNWPPESCVSLVVECGLDVSGIVSVNIIPVFMDDDYQIRTLSVNERGKLLYKIEQRSRKTMNSYYSRFWCRYDKEMQIALSKESVHNRLRKIKDIRITNLPRKLGVLGKLLLRYLILRLRFAIA